MAERMGCIYIITNDINDKVYVGQTLRDLQVRYSEHCYDTRSTSSIHQAIQKYGVSHFNIAVLEYVPFSKLDEREQQGFSNGFSNGSQQQLLSLIQKKIQKGKSLSVIADELEETVDTIRPLYERVQAELVTQK